MTGTLSFLVLFLVLFFIVFKLDVTGQYLPLKLGRVFVPEFCGFAIER